MNWRLSLFAWPVLLMSCRIKETSVRNSSSEVTLHQIAGEHDHPTAVSWTPNCNVIDSENQGVYDAALRQSITESGDAGPSDPIPPLEELMPRICLVDADGAWSTALQTLHFFGGGPYFESDSELVRLNKKGELLRLPTAGLHAYVGGSEGGPTEFGTFDFDDDGTPEIFFTQNVGHVEYADDRDLYMFQAKNGRIEPYKLGGITQLADVDKDGRPDGLIVHSATEVVGCQPYEDDELIGPSFVAHSVKGGFRTDDDFARAYALKACPSMPSVIMSADAHGIVDEDKSATNILCARVWGAPAKIVNDAITKACKPRVCASLAQQPPRAGECLHIPVLHRWADEEPAIFLRP